MEFFSLIKAESMQGDLSFAPLAALYPDWENDTVRIPGSTTVIL